MQLRSPDSAPWKWLNDWYDTAGGQFQTKSLGQNTKIPNKSPKNDQIAAILLIDQRSGKLTSWGWVLFPIIYKGVYTSQVVCRISEPSTVAPLVFCFATCSSLTQKIPFPSLSSFFLSQTYRSSLLPIGPLETEWARPERLSSEHWSAVAGLSFVRLKNPWKKQKECMQYAFKYT